MLYKKKIKQSIKNNYTQLIGKTAKKPSREGRNADIPLTWHAKSVLLTRREKNPPKTLGDYLQG